MISYDRSYRAPIPAELSRSLDFYGATIAADKLGITDRYIRLLAKDGELQAYCDPETPKLLFFKKSDINARMKRNPAGRN